MNKNNNIIAQKPKAQSSQPKTGKSQRPVKPITTKNVKK